MSKNQLLSAADAAKLLGVGEHEVRRLIRVGRLEALKIGRQYVIQRENLKKIEHGQPGRPKSLA